MTLEQHQNNKKFIQNLLEGYSNRICLEPLNYNKYLKILMELSTLSDCLDIYYNLEDFGSYQETLDFINNNYL